ncbi:STAS/SEC14 domain-containing protein [Polyangium sp. y55x31]|uniref:STAS/SEC14 domain-containing protein n=1 Tax=Polyangium sp. y55x31 TaxID=3042688 RepID=UPI002482C419|nr:STAS/SEC14 domain-containing protein [Polyangium sp. y55x31]MDI1480010.1 STAS/SEC14 domain-containing protein [Polyangium sp. y55x31]
MEHDASRIFRIGSAHRVTFEPPDLVVLSLHGPIEPDEMVALYDLLEGVAGGQPVMLLSDVSRSSGPTTQARKIAAKDPRAKLMGPMAMVGANFQVRVVVSMLETAARLMQGKTSPTEFFDDEETARAWLAEQRASLRAV